MKNQIFCTIWSNSHINNFKDFSFFTGRETLSEGFQPTEVSKECIKIKIGNIVLYEKLDMKYPYNSNAIKNNSILM